MTRTFLTIGIFHGNADYDPFSNSARIPLEGRVNAQTIADTLSEIAWQEKGDMPDEIILIEQDRVISVIAKGSDYE